MLSKLSVGDIIDALATITEIDIPEDSKVHGCTLVCIPTQPLMNLIVLGQ